MLASLFCNHTSKCFQAARGKGLLPSAGFWPGRRASFTFPCPAKFPSTRGSLRMPGIVPRRFIKRPFSLSFRSPVFKGTDAAFSFPRGLFQRDRERERERERGRGREGPHDRGVFFRGNSRRLGSVTKPTIGGSPLTCFVPPQTNPSYNTYQKFPRRFSRHSRAVDRENSSDSEK